VILYQPALMARLCLQTLCNIPKGLTFSVMGLLKGVIDQLVSLEGEISSQQGGGV
jgi:hypothetical protein